MKKMIVLFSMLLFTSAIFAKPIEYSDLVGRILLDIDGFGRCRAG